MDRPGIECARDSTEGEIADVLQAWASVIVGKMVSARCWISNSRMKDMFPISPCRLRKQSNVSCQMKVIFGQTAPGCNEKLGFGGSTPIAEGAGSVRH